MTIDDVADELYGLDPGDFVAARTARVNAARENKDRVLAAEIGKLRKPTTVGWLVNLLARDLPDDVGALLALGDSLRDAQQHLSGPDLRRLTAQRQQVVRALADKSGKLAAERGRTVGEDALRDVAQTLNAALADTETAQQVRQGRVVSAASYSGFGPAGLVVVKGNSAKSASSRPSGESSPTEVGSAERATAEAELAEATSRADEARTALDEATSALQELRSTVADIERRIDELRSELVHAEEQRRFARNTEKTSAASVHRFEQELRQAERRVRRAAASLEEIDRGQSLDLEHDSDIS